jgi:enamine deaminase RidA (YjgF/YER057c/UK114 family)
MTIRQLNPRELYDPAAFGMSQGVVDQVGGLVFISGQVAWDVNGRVIAHGVAEQTTVALGNLAVVLAAAGCTVADVLSVRVYVRGELADHMPACVPALASFFGATRPALTGIGVASLATPATLIAIEAVARVPAAS